MVFPRKNDSVAAATWLLVRADAWVIDFHVHVKVLILSEDPRDAGNQLLSILDQKDFYIRYLTVRIRLC